MSVFGRKECMRTSLNLVGRRVELLSAFLHIYSLIVKTLFLVFIYLLSRKVTL